MAENLSSRIEIGRGANGSPTWRVSISTLDSEEDVRAAYDLALELNGSLADLFTPRLLFPSDFDEVGPEL